MSDEAPSALDKAFRIYMLPQGLFSVAIATILFPRMSRLAARGAKVPAALRNRDLKEPNAASPEQHAQYERYRALLETEPEWHDGEIVFSLPG